MMRAVKERPRATAVAVLGALVIESSAGPARTQVPLASAKNAARDHARLPQAARIKMAGSRDALQRLARRFAHLVRRNAWLRPDLQQARGTGRPDRRRLGFRQGREG